MLKLTVVWFTVTLERFCNRTNIFFFILFRYIINVHNHIIDSLNTLDKSGKPRTGEIETKGLKRNLKNLINAVIKETQVWCGVLPYK